MGIGDSNIWETPIGHVALLAQAGVSTRQMALLAVITVAVVLMMLSNARRRREGGPSPKAYIREQRERHRQEKGLHADLDALLLHLQQVAREINAQLDAKYLRLERAMQQADAKIAQLTTDTTQSNRPSIFDAVVGDATSTQAPDPQCIARRSPPALTESERAKVHAMADEGKTAIDIARALDRRVGEIALILALGAHAELSSTSADS